MRRLRKFLRLPVSEQWLLVKVTCLLGLTWMGLRILPFNAVYRSVKQRSRYNHKESDKSIRPENICSAVERAGRYFLGLDSCFPQALVGEMLLNQNGYAAYLRLGVVRNEDGRLKAHAWVEREGVVVIGGPLDHVEKFIPLSELERINS